MRDKVNEKQMNAENMPNIAVRVLSAAVAAVLCLGAQASWYWPFGSDDDSSSRGQPRLSELMESASEAIDNASDLAADGKVEEAVAEYKRALAELDKVERENPERAATPEFATVRNKRAIINASIDSLYLTQARDNAKAVAVTDTTELEKRYAEMVAMRAAQPDGEKKADDGMPKTESRLDSYMKAERNHAKAVAAEAARVKREKVLNELVEKDPDGRKTRLMQAGELLRAGNAAEAIVKLDSLLAEDPDDVAALNMKAVCEASCGDAKAAAVTLNQAISANPRNYHAYYNMTRLVMQTSGKKEAARRYYETGRAVGGPEDKNLEKLFK